MLFQKHFDSAQYESHRGDGLQKLRPDAVPMVFFVFAEMKMKHKQYSKQGTCQIIAIVSIKCLLISFAFSNRNS